MRGAAADRTGHPGGRLPGGAQPERHRQDVKEAHVQQRPTEHPQEDGHEESGHHHLAPAAVLQELHGSARGNPDSVQRLSA